MDLQTYSFLAKFMWMPTVAAWALAWNRWRQPSWRTIDVAALAIMVAEIVGAMTHAASVNSVSRLASIVLFVLIGARIVRGGAMRIHAMITLAFITLTIFGDELLDPIGVPGIWFPFGIGVSRTQYIYALFIPVLAFCSSEPWVPLGRLRSRHPMSVASKLCPLLPSSDS